MEKMTLKTLKLRYLEILRYLNAGEHRFVAGSRNKYVFDFINRVDRDRLPVHPVALELFQSAHQVNNFPEHKQRLMIWLKRGPRRPPKYFLIKTPKDGDPRK